MLRKKILSLVFILFVSSCMTGCTTLRKKFVRKRKSETAPTLYLDLKDYPDVPTREMFHPYYLYVRGWLAELIDLMNNGTNKKRMRYCIDMSMESLTQIKTYLNDSGKERLQPVMADALELRKLVYDSANIDNRRTVIKKKAQKLRRKFEKSFRYEDVKGFLGGN